MDNTVVERERSYPTPFANSSLLPLLLLSLASQKHSPSTKKVFRPAYDYIVVGAGTAGSVVAARLSEIPCVNVLLLEAGGAPPLLSEVPIVFTAFINTEFDWQFRTVPQKYVGNGLINREIFVPRGKMLGGTGSLNGNQYQRGSPLCYDNWAAGGATGWSYKDVLPYFKKMEDNQDEEYVANGYHGECGPVTVSTPCYTSETKFPLMHALETLGYKKVDPNGANNTGAYDLQATMRNGQRCATAKAYLVPNEDRPNLDIVANAFVTKILFDRNRHATGVLFSINGNKHYVRANKEIIVSAGTISTPPLLMLSGIGPARELRRLGIPVIADLPVGRNLHDHVSINLGFELSDSIVSIVKKVKDDNNIKTYIKDRSGPLAEPVGMAMVGLLRSKFSNPSVDLPTIQFNFKDASCAGFKVKSGYLKKIYDQVYAPYENKTFLVCQAILLQPKTRGTIRLRSRNPYDAPVIDLQYLQNPKDLEDLVEAMKLCKRVMSTEPMRKIGAKPFDTLFPGCEHLESNDDLYYRCLARLVTTGNCHQVGTAKMGDPNDRTTVVDPELKVKFVSGLRVVDGSIMPNVINGNTNAPITMIAEKASDMIKESITCNLQDQCLQEY